MPKILLIRFACEGLNYRRIQEKLSRGPSKKNWNIKITWIRDLDWKEKVSWNWKIKVSWNRIAKKSTKRKKRKKITKKKQIEKIKYNRKYWRITKIKWNDNSGWRKPTKSDIGYH